MKKPLSLGGGSRAPLSAMLLALGFWVAACTSSDPEVDALPSSPETSGSGTPAPVPAGSSSDPGAVEPGGVIGAPGEPTPASTPPVNDGPGATETNFLTPPCGSDVTRERPDAGDAGSADPPALQALDAGVDAGASPARCATPTEP